MPEANGDGGGEWTVVCGGSRQGKRRGGRGGSHRGGSQQQQEGQGKSKALPAWHQSALRAGYTEEEAEREAGRLRAALEERKAAMRGSAFYQRLEAEVRRRLRAGRDEATGDGDGGGGGDREKGEEERVAALVCYGLGSVQSTTCNALWQLACLLLLRDAFLPLPGPAAPGVEQEGGGARAEVFDPIFDTVDRRLLRSLGLAVLAEDDAGKRRVEERDDKALFFMPHCPRRLYSNLLWANWAPDALPRLVVAGNSLASYVDRALPSEQGKDPTDTLTPLLPLARETPIAWTAPPKNQEQGQQSSDVVASAEVGEQGGAVVKDDGRAWEAGAPAAFMDFSVFDFPDAPPATDTDFWEARRPAEHTGPMTDG